MEMDERNQNSIIGLTPIEAAAYIINLSYEVETNATQKAFGCGDKAIIPVFDVKELRQIAEHILVYCNANDETTGG